MYIYIHSDGIYLILFKINLFSWSRIDISSVLLFNRTFGSARKTIIFYVTHKSHLFVSHLYWDASDSILHFRWKSFPFAFNVQRYLDSSVSLIRDMCLQDCI